MVIVRSDIFQKNCHKGSKGPHRKNVSHRPQEPTDTNLFYLCDPGVLAAAELKQLCVSLRYLGPAVQIFGLEAFLRALQRPQVHSLDFSLTS